MATITFQQVGLLLVLHRILVNQSGIRMYDVTGHPQIVTNHGLSEIVHQRTSQKLKFFQIVFRIHFFNISELMKVLVCGYTQHSPTSDPHDVQENI